MLDSEGLPENLRAVMSGEPLGKVFPVSPEEIGEISRIGNLYAQQAQWERAANVFNGLIALAPNHYLGHAGMGDLLLRQKKVKEAFAPLLKAATINSNDPYVCTNLGEVLMRLNKIKEAMTLLQSVTEMDPQQRHPACNRARALLEALRERMQSAAPAEGAAPKS